MKDFMDFLVDLIALAILAFILLLNAVGGRNVPKKKVKTRDLR